MENAGGTSASKAALERLSAVSSLNLGMHGGSLPPRRIKKKVIANVRIPLTMLRRKLSISDFSAGQSGFKKHQTLGFNLVNKERLDKRLQSPNKHRSTGLHALLKASSFELDTSDL